MPLTPDEKTALKAKLQVLTNLVDHLKSDRNLLNQRIANAQAQKQRLQDITDESLQPDVERQTLIDYIKEV